MNNQPRSHSVNTHKAGAKTRQRSAAFGAGNPRSKPANNAGYNAMPATSIAVMPIEKMRLGTPN